MTRADNTLDLFAGPGGWDEGVRALGLRPVGVEWDEAACKTAAAAGHARFMHDVAALDPREFAATVFDGPVRGLIASPPCQGFSLAGKGRGRQDAHLLLAAIPHMTARDVRPELREAMADHRSLLVLEPLRWALALTPSWLAWEQVPAVLPIWQACADVLRTLGYSVDVGNLHAEQYGVPQTRKRAILVARAPWAARPLGGPAKLPAPTHSRYYSRTPDKLDVGLPRWVSMAEALGWATTDRVGFPRRADDRDVVTVGGVDYRARDLHPASRPAPALTEKARSWSRVAMCSAGQTSPQTSGQVPRDPHEAPSATLTGKGTAYWVPTTVRTSMGTPKVDGRNGTHELDPFTRPAHTVTGKVGSWEYVNGTGANAARRSDDEPAPTVHFGERLNTVEWQMASGTRENAVMRRADEPSPTLALGHDAASYAFVPPGTTPAEVPAAKKDGTAVRVSIEEAAVLQSFPRGYPWSGTKTAQYRQVGDAVPPLLAAHIVSAVAAIPLTEEEPGPFAVGMRVEVHPVEGGYLVVPEGEGAA